MVELLLPVVAETVGSSRTRFAWPQDNSHELAAELKKEGVFVCASRRAGQVGLYCGQRPFEAGDTTLSAEPLAWVVLCPQDADFEELRCAYCGCDEGTLEKCSACGAVYFCDKCQSKKQKVHICGPDWMKATPSLRLAALLVRQSNDDEALRSYLLESSEASSESEDETVLFARAAVARLVSGDPLLIEKTLCKLKHYGHALADDELRVLGLGLFPRVATAANHSCRPNVWPRFTVTRGKKPLLNYVATQTIKPLDEIFHEYVDQALTTTDRKKKLKEGYAFLCACDKCFGNNLQEDQTFHRARDAAESAIEGRDFPSAAKALDDASKGFEELYHGAHPHKALHYLKLAKIQMAINEDPQRIRANLQIAIARLAVTHGPQARLTLLAQDLAQDLESQRQEEY